MQQKVKRMWIVTLVKTPVVNDFRSDYFPRKCHYKKDALALKEEVEKKGGQATVTPAKTHRER